MADQIDWAMNNLSQTTGRAYARLRAWQVEGRVGFPGLPYSRSVFPFPDDLDEFLARLCGYSSVHDMAHNYRPETTRILELLVGENGYTVYKMLEARNGG